MMSARDVLCHNWWKILLSWNVLSTVGLVLAIVYSPVKANVNQNSQSSTPVASSVTVSVTPTDVSLRTDRPASDNSSELTPQAADCSVNISQVCSNSELSCSQLSGYCIECDFNKSCTYGTNLTASCKPKEDVNCSGETRFERVYSCSYCYQIPVQNPLEQCNHSTSCALNKPSNFYPARPHFISTCWTPPDTLCLGRRCFHKKLPCNWSRGYKWSTAMLLSIFLGGFGADRFYLGLWKEAIGKLLSFGGLGVWTLVDVILIAVGYIGPTDGSIYL